MNLPIIIISYFCLIVFGLVDNIRGPLFSEILKEFHVSDFLGSLFFSLSSIFGFIISLSSIYFFKLISKKNLLLIATFGLFLTLSSYLIVANFLWVLILASLYGVFAGLLGLLPNVLVPNATLPHHRQQFLSGLHSMYGISSLMAPLLTAFIMDKTHSFRMCFFYTSLFSLTLFAVTFVLKLNLNQSKDQEIETDKNESIKEKKTKAPIKKMAFFGISLSTAVMTEVLISSRLPLILERQLSFNLNQSSLYLSYFFICLLSGRLIFTFIKLPYTLYQQVTTLELLTLFSFFLGLFFHPFFLVLAGLFIAPVYPLIAAIIAEKFKGHVDSAMSLIVSMNSLFLASMHLFVGKITDLFSIKMAFMLGPLFLFISLLVLNYENIFLRKNKN